VERGERDTAVEKCERNGCSKAPSFDFEAIKGRRFCAQHKLKGMVYLKCASRLDDALGGGLFQL